MIQFTNCTVFLHCYEANLKLIYFLVLQTLIGHIFFPLGSHWLISNTPISVWVYNGGPGFGSMSLVSNATVHTMVMAASLSGLFIIEDPTLSL